MSLNILNIDNEVFYGKRFINLCRQYIGREFKEYLYLWLKIVIIFAICGFLFNFFVGGYQEYNYNFKISSFDVLFKIILYIGIIGKAVNAFAEYREKEQAIAWMLLPGSAFEKFLSRIMISFFGLIILIYLSYFIGLNLGSIISTLILGHDFTLYIPLTSSKYFYYHPVENIITYLITILNIHAIFFTGGLYFKKHPIIKTCLTVAVISLALMIILSAFGGLAHAMRNSSPGETYYILNHYWPMFAGRFAKILFYCIVPIFCWIILYYKLKDKQII